MPVRSFFGVAGFLRTLFRPGALPDALRAELEPEGILAVFEHVKVRYRFSGRVPGLVAALERRSYRGALVLTRARVVGTLSAFPGATAARAVDVAWTTGDDGAVQLIVSSAGVHLLIDLAKVAPTDFSGDQSLDYVQLLPPELLAELPKTRVGFDIPREFVLRLAGVPVRPPKA